MSATVCNVLEVMLRTPGESINATAKMRRIVFILDGLLNVNLRAINRNEKIHQDQDSHSVLHYQQCDLVTMRTVLYDLHSKSQRQIAHKVLDCPQSPRHFVCVKSQRFRRL